MSSNSMIAATIVSVPTDEAHVRASPRFSEGMEGAPPAASTLRLGRFSDGIAQPLAMSSDQLGSFADGLVERPDASVARRVGGFSDGYGSAGSGRPVRVRRLQRAARAHA